MKKETLYHRIDAKERVPIASGWYNTDKRELYWFDKEGEWSCRDDRVSEEHPYYWYLPVQESDIIATDKEIEDGGNQWKEALGMNPYRIYANKDFMAGATAMRDTIATYLNGTFEKMFSIYSKHKI